MTEYTVANEARESIQFLSATGKAVVTKRSPFSGVYHRATFVLTDEQYSDWLNGELIQRAMRHLSAEDREFFITGITPAEWEGTFGKEDDIPPDLWRSFGGR